MDARSKEWQVTPNRICENQLSADVTVQIEAVIQALQKVTWVYEEKVMTSESLKNGKDGRVLNSELSCLDSICLEQGQLWLTKAQSRVAPYLELFGIHYSTCVPILVLLCKFEQLI